MNTIEISNELIQFIESSPSMFHSIKTIRTYLDEAGFTYLPESKAWDVKAGGKYYTIRNHSSLIAFKVGKELDSYHFQMCASHSDSPTYKVKNVPELEGPKEYLRLDVEAYGGMIDNTWFDRPLTVAGRVLVRNGSKIESKLLYIDKDILIIPNVAIHFNREVNNGYKYNRQIVADELGVKAEDILGKDLFLVNRQKGLVWGLENEFVSSPKLDDLQCAFVSLKAFIEAENEKSVNVYCCFDNEEVGSNTKQGAMSTFLKDVLHRINAGLGKTEDEYYQAIAKTFLVSCDNAHALHPNHAEKTDAVNFVTMNGGIVIKESANQKYTTDAFSRALFTGVCQNVNVPVQSFANRSDVVGGSTLGNLSNTQVSVHAVDFGLAQLAMHSCFETAGVKDTEYAIVALKEFYETNVQIEEAESVCLEK